MPRSSPQSFFLGTLFTGGYVCTHRPMLYFAFLSPNAGYTVPEMRDINKELEKFYSLLDALESDENQQPSSSTPDTSDQVNGRLDRAPIAGSGNPERKPSPPVSQPVQRSVDAPNTGVYAGKSFRTPKKTIDSNAVRESALKQSASAAGGRENASNPAKQAAKPTEPRPYVVPSTKASIQSLPKQDAPQEPISNLPADLIPYRRASQQSRSQEYRPNDATARQTGAPTPEARSNQAKGQNLGASARPSKELGHQPHQRPAVARPANRPAASAQPPMSRRTDKPSPADIKPAAPAQPTARTSMPDLPKSTPAKPNTDEAWLRKVKLPSPNVVEPGNQAAPRSLDALVSDVKEGLTKRTESSSKKTETSRFIPDTKFSSDSPTSKTHTKTRPVIAPELLELPPDETPARSRFTLVAAAAALVVPTILAGVLVFNMSGDPESVGMVASSTLENGKAVLSMSTDPEGARVYLNNNLVGVTPFSGVKVEPGDYVVTTEKEGFIQADTVMRISGSEQIAFNLSRIDGSISGLPAGGHILSGLVAEDSVSLDDDELALEGQSGEDESLALNDQAETSRDREIEDRPALNEAIESQPERTSSRDREETPRVRTGGLVLTSEPAGATVWIDGTMLGETPITLKELRTGSYEVQLTKDGFENYVTDLTVSPSIARPYHSKLSALNGTIAVTVNVPSDIYIDGTKVANQVSGLGRFEVPAGLHSLRLVSREMGETERQVTVEPGKEAELAVDLQTGATEQLQREASALFAAGEYEAAKELYSKISLLQPSNALAAAKVKEIDRLLASMVDQELTDAIIEDGVYLVVDSPPQLVGGLEALHQKVVFPDAAYRAGISGRVYVQFVVDENGNPSDFSITRGLKLGCNDAAIDAIAKSKFVPGQFRGRSVKSRHTLFVNFGG